MEPVEGVYFVNADMYQETTINTVRSYFPAGIDFLVRYVFNVLMISDMAPNMTGDNFVDYNSSCEMLECVLNSYVPMVNARGHFVYKIFEGPRTTGSYENVYCRVCQVLKGNIQGEQKIQAEGIPERIK